MLLAIHWLESPVAIAEASGQRGNDPVLWRRQQRVAAGRAQAEVAASTEAVELAKEADLKRNDGISEFPLARLMRSVQ